MRILLIQAPLGRSEPVVYPLGLAFLAGALRAHDVVVFDPNLPDSNTGKLRDIIAQHQPELIGFSLRNIDSQMLRDLHFYLPPFQELVRDVRRSATAASLVVGGAGFSLFPEEVMARTPELDLGVRLEGEKTFAALAGGQAAASLPGIYYRKNGRVTANPPGPFQDFSELPDPDWNTVNVAPYAGQRGAVGIQTKRGCHLKCAYCTYPLLNGRQIRRRDPAVVVDEIEYLVRERGVRHFTFVDSMLNIPEDHAWRILELLHQRRLPAKWSGWFHERPLTEEMVKLALAAGCDEFQFSPDAYNDRALAALHKEATTADIDKVIALLERMPGMRASFNFFINPPHNDLRTTLRLLKLFVRAKTQWRDRISGFVLASPRVEPDTAIYARAVREGVVDAALPLLPESVEGLKRLFYYNRGTAYVEYAFRAYIRAWKLRQRLRRGGSVA